MNQFRSSCYLPTAPGPAWSLAHSSTKYRCSQTWGVPKCNRYIQHLLTSLAQRSAWYVTCPNWHAQYISRLVLQCQGFFEGHLFHCWIWFFDGSSNPDCVARCRNIFHPLRGRLSVSPPYLLVLLLKLAPKLHWSKRARFVEFPDKSRKMSIPCYSWKVLLGWGRRGSCGVLHVSRSSRVGLAKMRNNDFAMSASMCWSWILVVHSAHQRCSTGGGVFRASWR